VELAITKFSDVRVDKIIFTKIDEAAHVGPFSTSCVR
jgi:flagellar biosynthesis GTPase FlhF